MSLEGAIAVTRFGLGAKTGEIDEVSRDPRGWLRAQLTADSAARFIGDGLPSSKQGLTELQTYFETRRRGEAQIDPQKVEAFRMSVVKVAIGETAARTRFGASTPAGFHERLVRFWANHFTVSGLKAQTILVAGAYEREAIRPNSLGTFRDLAHAAIFHPAMLVYLDNWQSVGPGSRGGRLSGRGLNENLAREVLELHTVTPKAGYMQADVTEFARALTGWTVGNRRVGRQKMGETVFSPLIHEPGIRTVLGQRYPEDGEVQARAVLDDLCARPETAENVALKLARHIIADAPPARAVAALADSFRRTGGDLQALYRTLIDLPEAWIPQAQKVKTPDELLTSTARLIGAEAVFAGKPRDVLESFAQRPFTAPSPEGWPDMADAWIGPDALSKRIEWANRLAARMPTRDARALLVEALGERADPDTLQAVSRAESGEQALVLALMSPDYQRR